MTVACADLTDYGKDPVLENEALTWKDPPAEPRDYSMVRPASDPFQPDGGMKLLTGNLGRCIMQTSAVDPSHWTIQVPVRVFSTHEGVIDAFKEGELDRAVRVFGRFKGPGPHDLPAL